MPELRRSSVKAFQFSNKRVARERVKVRSYGNVEKTPSDDPQPVHGIMPDSKEEYWVAIALDKLKIEFDYQYEVSGGRNLKGGQIVDFMAWTAPLPTPIYIQGKYWHSGLQKMQDILNVEALKSLYHGQIRDPLLIDTELLANQSMAYNTIKRLLV